MSSTTSEFISVKTQAFLASRAKLAGLDVEGHEFCCGAHQKVFFEIQQRAASDKTLSLNQVDFARDIWMGRASHKVSSVDPNAVPRDGIRVKCVHRLVEERSVFDEDGNATGETVTVFVPCGKAITGTRAQIGEWGTRCEEHRS